MHAGGVVDHAVLHHGVGLVVPRRRHHDRRRTYHLLVLNPFPDDAIVDFTSPPTTGPATPSALQGFVVKARSLRIVDVDEAVQRDKLVSASVRRPQRPGRGRPVPDDAVRPRPQGPRATLGAPSAGSQWWFANGQKGDGVAERVVLYNPGSRRRERRRDLLPGRPRHGQPGAAQYTVPAGQRVEPSTSAPPTRCRPGRTASWWRTDPDQPVVAERVLDLVAKARTATTVQAGSRLAATRWYVPGGRAGRRHERG